MAWQSHIINCHCEERSDVAISSFFLRDCHAPLGHSQRQILRDCAPCSEQNEESSSLAMGIILTEWSYSHIFTLTCWIHKILKLTQIKGFSMDDLKTFLPQMLKMFNFCIKKSLYDANLNITTVMVSSTF